MNQDTPSPVDTPMSAAMPNNLNVEPPKKQSPLAMILLCILAVCGIGFGVYGMFFAPKPEASCPICEKCETKNCKENESESANETAKDCERETIKEYTDISGVENLIERIKEEKNTSDVSFIEYKNAFKSSDSQAEIVSFDIFPEDNLTGGYIQMYYRLDGNEEWVLLSEGNGIPNCKDFSEEIINNLSRMGWSCYDSE